MLANHPAPASNDLPQGDSDYDSILAALMETARGRAFLQEYALRSRAADTATLLTAIGRIEGLLESRALEPASPPHPDDMPPSEPAEAAEVLDVEAAAADPAADIMEGVAFPAEIFEVDDAPADAPVLHVSALHVSAIEFLGPSLAETPPAVSAPQPVRPQRQTRDPFADIRALSEAEKIALFT